MDEDLLLLVQNKKVSEQLSKGLNVNQKDTQGRTLLFYSCESFHHFNVFEQLLKHPHIQINLCTRSGSSPLYTASYYGNDIHVMALLADGRCNVNLSNANDNSLTPLMGACYKNNLQTIKLLLSFGRKVDVDKKTTSETSDGHVNFCVGMTALDIAQKKGSILAALLIQENKFNPIKTVNAWRQQLDLQGTKQNIKKKEKKEKIKKRKRKRVR